MTTPSIEIRELESTEDCQAGVELQREIWGFGIGEIVPASVLHIVTFVGGLAAGAFDDQGQMLGFVFGVSGVRDGVPSHWSHMLAVRDGARDRGVGRMLKEFQRTRLARIGIERVYWTFDPLQPKNAHFNLNRLGAAVDRYVPDMYGNTGSPLHLGLPTDRLIVHTDTAAPPPAGAAISPGDAPIMTPFARAGDRLLNRSATVPVALIEIPADIVAITKESIENGREWRLSVRESFQWAFAGGYTVRGVYRDPRAGRSFYMVVSSR